MPRARPLSMDPQRRAVLCTAVATALPLRASARTRLSIAAYPLIDEIVKAALPQWRRLHPEVEIEVFSRQYADHHTAMTTALSTSAHLPDVMALEASYLGRFSAGGGLERLAGPPYGVEALQDRYVGYAYAAALNPQGQPVAVPTDVGPGTMLYRVDLLDRAGLQVADLSPSWEAYVEAGARIKAATGAYLISNAQALKDILLRTGVGDGEGLYFDRNSNVLVTSARFVRAFTLAREVRQRKLDARVTAWSNEWAEGFRRGRLATELSGAWMVGQMANWVAPGTRGLWRAAQLPGATFVGYGGTFYALPRRADPARRALAWDLIRLLTLDPGLQLAAFKSQDAFPALLATHEDPFFDEPLPFLGGQRARQLWREAARRIGPVRVHKQNNFADEVIGTELDNVIDRGKDIGRALADAARLLERRARR
jgi:multiple sugar transport system substrate-binding protein